MTAPLWSGASYERIAQTFAPIHDRVAAELGAAPGKAFLDLACGTGGVALRAARRGADVTGVDISPDQLEKARAAAEAEGVAVRFDEGDCQALPYGDGAFEAVASVFGLIFAASHARAAHELARVTRRGGRIAFTAWHDDDWAQLARDLGRPDPPGDAATEWSGEDYVRTLLEDAFELRFDAGEWVVVDSPQGLWELVSTSAPPIRAWLETLTTARRAEVEQAYLTFFAPGEIRRRYVLVLGSRR